jgi:glucose-1-phosphatase
MRNIGAIKNIIFDLGGVLLNIDPNLTGKALTSMGVAPMEKVHARLSESRLYQRFDTGQCSPECFRDEIRIACGLNLTDQQVDKAWNALLLDFPPERVDMLHQLKNHYRLFLLSNTNSIHFKSYTANFFDKHGEELPALFEKIFLSYELGMHKPDGEIYTKVLELGNLIPSETLFIDDSLANAEAAVRAGMLAYHLANGEEVTAHIINGKLRHEAEFLLP